jgi:hypothetical protein
MEDGPVLEVCHDGSLGESDQLRIGVAMEQQVCHSRHPSV